MTDIRLLLLALPNPLTEPNWEKFQAVEVALEFWRRLVELGFKVVPQFVWALGILVLTRLAISAIGRLIRKALGPMQPTLRKFCVQAAEILTLIVGVVAALNAAGIQSTSLVAVVGATSLAIGLAWQNTLSHFAAGVMLISLRPFEVGDSIEGATVAGTVDAIGIFSTTLVTPDNVRITVPNGQLFNGTLKNTTAMKTRRVDIEIPIGDRPIGPMMTMFLEVAHSHPLVLEDPEPTCLVASIKEGTFLVLRPWCATVVYEQVRSQLQHRVKDVLDATQPPVSTEAESSTPNQS